MARGGIRLAGLPVLVLLAVLVGGFARAEEPLRLDDAALDDITAAGTQKIKVGGLVSQAVLPGSGKGLAELALQLARQKPTVVPTTGSTGNGKRTVSGSGKKTFKAERVTKGHLEILVVSGSAGG